MLLIALIIAVVWNYKEYKADRLLSRNNSFHNNINNNITDNNNDNIVNETTSLLSRK
jgi:hypothetical protein